MSDTLSTTIVANWLKTTKLGETYGNPKDIRDELAVAMARVNTRSNHQIRENLHFLHMLYDAFNTLAENEGKPIAA